MAEYFQIDTKSNDLLNTQQKELVQKLTILLNELSPPHVDPSKTQVYFPKDTHSFTVVIPHQKFGLSICIEQNLLDELTIYWVNNRWFYDDFYNNPVGSFDLLELNDRWIDLAINCVNEQLTRPIYISEYYSKNKLVKSIYYIKNNDYLKIRTDRIKFTFFDLFRLKRIKKYVSTFAE